METWSEYFELSKNRGPLPLLETALKLVVERRHALDLGAGSLKDSKFMLSMGFRKVTAVDADPGVRKYRNKVPVSQLTIKVTPFEQLKLKPTTYDFISAQYSLPFITPPNLPNLIDQIINSLNPCGIFCAQFFGPEDGWNKPENNMSFVTKAELKKLLKPLQTILFEEEFLDAKTIDGQPKHWHLFHVIAIKPALR